MSETEASRSPSQIAVRLVRALLVFALVATILIPVAPKWLVGNLGSKLATPLLRISIRQAWQMYAPNPQRAQVYMNLQAIYTDGRVVDLQETADEKDGWGGEFFWSKTRMDIWRQYASFHPKGRNENRIWYLKGVCVREARRGDTPHRIVMHQVRRRFTPPHKVAKGAAGLRKPKKSFVTVQYCKSPQVLEMIEADQARRGV